MNQYSPQVSGELKLVKKFKDLGFAFTSDGRQDEELDVRSRKASGVVQVLHHLLIFERELSKAEVKRLVFLVDIIVPVITYGYESWVMTERMRSPIQASEMRLLRRFTFTFTFIFSRHRREEGAENTLSGIA